LHKKHRFEVAVSQEHKKCTLLAATILHDATVLFGVDKRIDFRTENKMNMGITICNE